MPTSWAINAAGLYFIAVGALLIFLYLWRSHKTAERWLSPEGKVAYAKHSRLLIIGMGFLALWLVMQYLEVILL